MVMGMRLPCVYWRGAVFLFFFFFWLSHWCLVRQGLWVSKLIAWFVANPGTNTADPYQFTANVLVNISQLRPGRAFLLLEKRNTMQLLIPFLASSNPIRQRGVLQTVRNCCYERHRHAFLVGAELGLLPRLVAPIIGPEFIPEEVRARPAHQEDACLPNIRP